MATTIYVKDEIDFQKSKQDLNGFVFWRRIDNLKVEIKIALNYTFSRNATVKEIVKSLKN